MSDQTIEALKARVEEARSALSLARQEMARTRDAVKELEAFLEARQRELIAALRAEVERLQS